MSVRSEEIGLAAHDAAQIPLLYLSRADVESAMPGVEERLALAQRALVSLEKEAAQLPPKIGVHPRPRASFAHAMPAALVPDGESVKSDLLGVKWVVGFPPNRGLGLPALHALVILNDPSNGLPVVIADGAVITAARTAAVSGLAIRYLAPKVDGRPPRVAIIGAGVQSMAHLPVIGHLLRGSYVSCYDRHPERATAFAERASRTDGIDAAVVRSSAREAVADADIVITAASFGPVRQTMPGDWLVANALVIAIDYATICSSSVALGADLFLTDHIGQFEAAVHSGLFEGYPRPSGTLAAMMLATTARPTGRVLVTHLGVGLADVMFADAVARSAALSHLGLRLPR